MSYGRLAAEQQTFYLTQGGSVGKEALAKGDVSGFEQPTHFIFGKSLTESSITGDIFESVTPGSIPPTRIPGYQQQTHEDLSVELGDWWGFYRDFWKAHNLEHVAHLLPVAEVAIPRGGSLHVPLLIRNDTENPEEVNLTAVLPRGWTEKTGSGRYPVRAHDIYPAQLVLIAPDTDGVLWQEITWNAEANGRLVGTFKLRVLSGVDNGGLPQ